MKHFLIHLDLSLQSSKFWNREISWILAELIFYHNFHGGQWYDALPSIYCIEPFCYFPMTFQLYEMPNLRLFFVTKRWFILRILKLWDLIHNTVFFSLTCDWVQVYSWNISVQHLQLLPFTKNTSKDNLELYLKWQAWMAWFGEKD